jgi:multidrug resistance efflux pump
MSFNFRRTNFALHGDGATPSSIVLLIGLILVAAWIGWAFRARIIRYEVADRARLEVTAAAYPIQATVSGRLVADGLVLGRDVHAGEILAELDSEAEQLNIEEERSRVAAFQPQIRALEAQMASETSGGENDQRALTFSLQAAKAEVQQAAVQAALAAKEAQRAESLRKEGIIAEAEVQRAEADVRAKRAAEENLRAALSRLTPEQQARDADREMKVRDLAGQIAKLKADWAASLATVRRLEYELERRKIRAPISGKLGESAVLRPGSHIAEGQQLGVIVPTGRVQITAEFQPSAAFGKLRPGQSATFRVQGFPWAQYGTVAAQVREVAGEIRDGEVRVELAVNGPAPKKIPLQHGLPGSIEVEIERISPAALILRSAGDLVGAH